MTLSEWPIWNRLRTALERLSKRSRRAPRGSRKNRKPRPTGDARRSNVLLVRLRKDERARVEQAARDAGLTLSEHVRQRILQ